MSETQTRPSAPRGRGSARGGRGGFGSRGGARGGSRSAINGEKAGDTLAESEIEEGEIGELKKLYSGKLSTVKEMFPDWTDEDIVFALQETNGDLEEAVERITEGSISQWGEVKKKTKDRSRSKVKEPMTTGISDGTPIPIGRGGRGRGGFEGGRGGRGRGVDRGRGTGRGGRGGSIPSSNGIRQSNPTLGSSEIVTEGNKESIPTEESSAWETIPAKVDSSESIWDQPPANTGSGDSSGGSVVPSDTTPGAASEGQKSSLIPNGAKKSWASFFAKPVAPVLSKVPLPQVDQDIPSESAQELNASDLEQTEPESLPPPLVGSEPSATGESTPVGTPAIIPSEPALEITPSKDELTEINLEQVLDTSIPPATATAASTVASSRVGSATPLTAIQQPPLPRPPMGGFATSAYKATGTPGRTSSFQRRVLDQQEAVVMPGKHAVDRAAVQFGSMGMNGGSDDLDVDEEREEAETRAQPPQHSPIAQPRASLPPAPQSLSGLPQQPEMESMQTRQAPGLPPAPQQQQQSIAQLQSPQPPVGPQVMSHQNSQGSHQYGQFGRYGQQPLQQDQSAPTQKSYDPFGQQASQAQSHQTQYDGYSGQSQAQTQSQPQQSAQSHLGGFSSAPSDYSAYYTSDQQRNAYQNYYGSTYGQQGGQNQQDAGTTQQRSASGFGGATADPTSQYSATQTPQPQSRYSQVSEAQASGHTTPNPTISGQPQQQQHQSAQPQHMHQQAQGQSGGQHGGYPYGHPYYSSPYYAAYINQFGYGGGQGYGAPYGNKGGMYGQPHQGYGMTPQSSYEHSSSPANIGGFGQPSSHGRDNAHGSLGDYGRSGSAQPAQSQQHSAGSGAFGGMPDVFGRSGSGFGGQNQQLGQQPGAQQVGMDDSLKPFGESKASAGPSPSLNQPGRPGSATNNPPGQPSQSGLPPPQSQQGQQGQQGFGGYPNHVSHQGQHSGQGGQYGNLGGLGGHQSGGQSHQGSGYGSYGAGFGNYYGNNAGRGGWGGNYGQH
ncbi:MAG: RNAPII degradation factor [Pycnora praestabilis]|nr:MAG: RNAPII degradation factor [Pycnora praestabilis]